MTPAELEHAARRVRIEAAPTGRGYVTDSKWEPAEMFGHPTCPDCGYSQGRHGRFCELRRPN